MTFFNIFRSEVKYQLRSIVFWLFVIVTILFTFSQFGILKGNEQFNPEPGSKHYGYTQNLTPEEEMKQIAMYLRRDILRKETSQLALIINKQIKLDQKTLEAMKELLYEIENKKISYDEFIKKTGEIDKMLGGNTIYGEQLRREFLSRPKTYEEAKQDFNIKVEKEGLTNAFGRLFADYLGITAGFFPVFISAFMLSRDRRTKMDELISVRQLRPLVYVGAKYLAVVFLAGTVYLLLAVQPSWAFYKICTANGWDFHPFGFARYVVQWVIPTLMFTSALSMAIAELFRSGLFAIPLQLLLWFNSISSLKGEYSLSKYIIRFNSTGHYDLYLNSYNAIVVNRLFYLAVSILLVAICALIWNKRNVLEKRGFNAGKLLRNA